MTDDEDLLEQIRASMERLHPGITRTKGKYILNADGEAEECTDLVRWAAWYETADRQVCDDRDESGGTDVRVSTVFLGMDQRFLREPDDKGPAVLWETRVFGGPLDGKMRRYTSRQDAALGHQDICREVNAALKAT